MATCLTLCLPPSAPLGTSKIGRSALQALLIVFLAMQMALATPTPFAADLQLQPQAHHQQQPQQTDLAERYLSLLTDELEPVVRAFAGAVGGLLAAGSGGGPTAPLSIGELMERALPNDSQAAANRDIWADLEGFLGHVGAFAREARDLLEMAQFCAYTDIQQLGQLREGPAAGASKILRAAYDLLVIDFHKRCLYDTLEKLPKVEYIIRDVVNMYSEGLNKPVPHIDLSTQGLALEAAHGGCAELDAAKAVADMGPLSSVTMLLLLSSSPDADPVASFKHECRTLVARLNAAWQSMEMMNTMVADEVNGVRRLNNYIMRSLAPTCYADACTRLSRIG